MSNRQIPSSQRPEPQPFSCDLSTRAWARGDELLLGFRAFGRGPGGTRNANSVCWMAHRVCPTCQWNSGHRGSDSRRRSSTQAALCPMS